MSVLHIDTTDPTVKRLLALVGFTGNRVELRTFRAPMSYSSYWDEGNRDTYTLVNLGTGEAAQLPENGPFSRGAPREIPALADGVVLVKHSSHGGRHSAAIYAMPGTFNPRMLAAAPERDLDERIVLFASRSLKSSYAGMKDFRFKTAQEETGITRERWEAAKARCIAAKLLNKAGAITVEGRNAIEDLKFSWPKEGV